MKKKEYVYQDFKISGFKLKKHLIMFPEAKQIYYFRSAQYYLNSKNIFLKLYWTLKWLKVRKRGCQLSLSAKIGSGLRFVHDGTRIIVGKSIIGENCAIGINVVIGYSYNKTKNNYYAPKIGDNVYIGHNSSIVGDISIGDNVLIAPNTYVNKDVPSNCIVLGNNVVIPSDNPSKPYLKI